jgi:hypothetical protein
MIRITTSEGQLIYDPAIGSWDGDRTLVELTDIHVAREQQLTPAGPFLEVDFTDEQWQLLHAADMLETAGIAYTVEEWPTMPDSETGCVTG